MSMIFFSSIPRSGSTLLSVLLRQRPDTHVSHTSNLSEVLGGLLNAYSKPISGTEGDNDTLVKRKQSALLSAIDAHYSHITNPIIFDKCRAWGHPSNVKILEDLGIDTKVIATVRPMTECVASAMKITGELDVSVFMETEFWWHMIRSRNALCDLYHASFIQDGIKHFPFVPEATPNKLLLIEYKDLVYTPQKELDRISSFIGVDSFTHQFDNIAPSEENDLAWGIPNLHQVHSTLSYDIDETQAKKILGNEAFRKISKMDFWGERGLAEIAIDRLLNLQLNAGIAGQFEMGQNLADQLKELDPDDCRASFNRGWYELRKGNLQEGHRLMDEGRKIQIFGNNHNGIKIPMWDGKTEGRILLALEGGLGDQIHGLRFAKQIKPTVISCSKELWPLIDMDVQLVTSEAHRYIDVDFFVPSMSAVHILGLEYKDLDGKPYIKRTAETIKGRIGVCWSGNPKFEHEQHRAFPPKLMFDVVKDLDCVSLQRDEDSELKPEWMPQANLHNWGATRKSISECELVITSCTSIAHLAGAMGIKTWIVVPILSYYLWALPTKTTPYYDSVKLFRQEDYGYWQKPFTEIGKELSGRKTKEKKSSETQQRDYKLTGTLPEPAFV